VRISRIVRRICAEMRHESAGLSKGTELSASFTDFSSASILTVPVVPGSACYAAASLEAVKFVEGWQNECKNDCRNEVIMNTEAP
jgi:hypothetical protein